MSKKPDTVRLVGLALVAAAIALYVRDCKRTRVEQTALLAVRAAAADPGAIVAFRVTGPDADGNAVYRPVRDPAVASNVVAALAATEPGWKGNRTPSSRIVGHDVMLLDSNRRSSFFNLRHESAQKAVWVELRAGPPPAPAPAGFPAMSTSAGLAEILDRIEAGELLDASAGIRLVPVPPPAETNAVPAEAR